MRCRGRSRLVQSLIFFFADCVELLPTDLPILFWMLDDFLFSCKDTKVLRKIFIQLRRSEILVTKTIILLLVRASCSYPIFFQYFYLIRTDYTDLHRFFSLDSFILFELMNLVCWFDRTRSPT